jgi:hypothetical protein
MARSNDLSTTAPARFQVFHHKNDCSVEALKCARIRPRVCRAMAGPELGFVRSPIRRSSFVCHGHMSSPRKSGLVSINIKGPAIDCQSGQPQQLAVGCLVDAAGGEIVEGPSGNLDDVRLDERCALLCPLLAVLDTALPFEYRPAVKARLAVRGSLPAIRSPAADRRRSPRVLAGASAVRVAFGRTNPILARRRYP